MSSRARFSRSPAGGNGRTSMEPGPECTGRHVEDLRALIYCGICVKPLYEPFTLGCGHTFCYSCLTQWFINDRRTQTCPDCRAAVKTEPAPAYLLRNIVHIFTGRPELLAKDETTAEHLESQKAEMERMEKDKTDSDSSTGGLFQGCFKKSMSLAAPIHDVEDDVDRCPECSWELEEGECLHCGFTLDLFSTSYLGSDGQDSVIMTDAGDDMDSESVPGGDYFMSGAFPMAESHQPLDWYTREAIRWNLDQFSGALGPEEESDEDYDSEMDSFIDDDIRRVDSEGTEQATVVDGNYLSDNSFPSRSGSPAEDGSSDDEYATPSMDGRREAIPDPVVLESSDDDDDDDEPIRPPGRVARQRPYLSTTRDGPFYARRSNRARSGSTVDNAISVDDDQEEGSRSSRQRSIDSNHSQAQPRNRRSSRSSPNAESDD